MGRIFAQGSHSPPPILIVMTKITMVIEAVMTHQESVQPVIGAARLPGAAARPEATAPSLE
jgi:hypothetical protein